MIKNNESRGTRSFKKVFPILLTSTWYFQSEDETLYLWSTEWNIIPLVDLADFGTSLDYKTHLILNILCNTDSQGSVPCFKSIQIFYCKTRRTWMCSHALTVVCCLVWDEGGLCPVARETPVTKAGIYSSVSRFMYLINGVSQRPLLYTSAVRMSLRRNCITSLSCCSFTAQDTWVFS